MFTLVQCVSPDDPWHNPTAIKVHYLGPFVELIEVVRGMSYFVRFKAEPRDHIANSGEKLFLFLLRIGVVVAKKTDALIIPGVAKVDVDCLSVTHVQDSIWLWRETRAHLSNTESTVVAQ